MKHVRLTGIAIVLLSSLAVLAGCEDDSFEEAGREVDRATSAAAETTEDAVDTAEDVAREAGNRIEDACEELTEDNC